MLYEELTPRKTLLIAVITSVQRLMSHTIAVHRTWGDTVQNLIYFMGEAYTMPHLPSNMSVVQLEGIDDQQASWEIKEYAVITYLISHYSDSTVDWFLLIGDNAFVSTDSLKMKLEEFSANIQVYMGRSMDGENRALCNPKTGIVYSRGLLKLLESYLILCAGEELSIGQCINARGIYCTQAKEAHKLFYLDREQVVEKNLPFSSKKLSHALVVYPIHYPKYMYQVYCYFQELAYNNSVRSAVSSINRIRKAHPSVPTHLCSLFKPETKTNDNFETEANMITETPPTAATCSIAIRPRHVPKDKFEINYWEYFNRTRLMGVHQLQPSHGLIGGIRQEANYALIKAIHTVNNELTPDQKLIFDKFENGYRRVDPMRGSEFILDLVFHKSTNHNAHIRKRVSILRPFHDHVVPVPAPESKATVNFVITLSDLSNRLEQFLANYGKNILRSYEHVSLTIVLYSGPDTAQVHSIVNKFSSDHPSATISVVDREGEFARGVGLDHGVQQFKDDELLFFVDVDLQINHSFLRRCRLNTIRGKQVYFPIFFKLYNLDFVSKYYEGNESMFLSRHNGHWAHYSYGMVCIYASDYRHSGGFNVDMRGWGEEDVDFLSRVMKHGLEVFRAPDPGLVHLWHRKTCKKSTQNLDKAYLHCLHSKKENLADRTELAQYVLENELNKGNEL